MSEKVKIAVLVSGGGTNLQALLDAQARGENPDGQIALVVSNVSGAYALERAAKAGVPTLRALKPRCKARWRNTASAWSSWRAFSASCRKTSPTAGRSGS